MTYLIVGLGNPGEDYISTRHNTGRILLEYIKKSIDSSEWKRDNTLKALVSKGEIKTEKKAEKVTLIEPETFMNKSGLSLKPLVDSEKKAEKVIVIYDDLDLPFGSIRMSFNRGSGGHKGLESIIKHIKTEKFIRIRVGISPTTSKGIIKKAQGEVNVEKCILGEFKKDELLALKKLSKKVIEILPIIFESGVSVAMTHFNQQ